MNRRALITGAGGFVGHYLRAQLEGNGWEVVCTTLHGEGGGIPCDVTNAQEVLSVFHAAGRVTHVFHLAALTFVPLAMKEPGTVMQVNYGGTVNTLQAMEGLAQPARFIFIGSADAYGPPLRLPVDEDHPLIPQNPYAISKAAADDYCRFASKASSVESIRLRPFNHSGPGQPDNFVLSSFARQVAEIEAGLQPPVLRVGNLEAARDFLHVKDVVRAYELAALHGDPGEVYNICSGTAQALDAAVQTLCDLATVPISVEVDAERLRPVDVKTVAGSHEKFSARTGWQPEIRFESLLQDLLDYWRGELKTGSNTNPDAQGQQSSVDQ
jgi:GDP-4-dehydro-6-deoxy-D-mannose reductase